MGGTTSRNKGKRGERMAIALLQPVVDRVYAEAGMEVPRLQRNTLQSDGGGFDVVGLAWLALEVKNCEVVALDRWWEQTVRQANDAQEPVLLFRRNRQRSWSVCMWGECGVSSRLPQMVRVTISEEDFVAWFEARLRAELGVEE